MAFPALPFQIGGRLIWLNWLYSIRVFFHLYGTYVPSFDSFFYFVRVFLRDLEPHLIKVIGLSTQKAVSQV